MKEIEAAARNVKGNEAIISVTTNFSDTLSERWRVASNGFSGGQRGTNFFMSAEVSAKEADGRKPEDYAYAGARFFRELPEVTSVVREAAERTIRFIGSKKADSAVLTMVLENRAAGRMMAFLQSPLSGAALQQKRSFYEGKLGQAVGSPLLTVTDDPLLPKGFGSRLCDAEGAPAVPGLDDEAPRLSREERARLAALPLDAAALGTDPVHALLLGPRGIGKTTLLARLGDRAREGGGARHRRCPP